MSDDDHTGTENGNVRRVESQSGEPETVLDIEDEDNMSRTDDALNDDLSGENSNEEDDDDDNLDDDIESGKGRKTQKVLNLISNLNMASDSPSSAKSGLLVPGKPTDESDRPVSSCSKQITVSWRNLRYTVERKQLALDNCFSAENGRSIVRQFKRNILKGISGNFSTGNLTAVMGPSGSGKSTMLECIVGFRKRGLLGDIRMNSNTNQNVKIALINQSDYLIEEFTVREMLIYASRLKNYRKSDKEEAKLEEVLTTSTSTIDVDSGGSNGNLSSTEANSKRNLLEDDKTVTNYHHKLTLNVVHQLGLEVCIDNRAGSCSGGQRKRISIALEMISKPNILILDEPTSGLDSSACYQTVTVMKRLSKNERNPIAVVCTIHQPSARVFNLFDHVYVISNNGYCIFEGSPAEMLEHLNAVDLRCPQFHNPADFIAEVASGEHGADAIERLIEKKQQQDAMLTEQQGSSRSLAQYSNLMSHPSGLHTWILYQRTTLHILRDPMLNTLRLMSHLLTAVFIGALYGDTIGKPSLCPPLESPLNDLESFPAYRLQFQSDTVTSAENLAFIFFSLMFVMFGAMMPTIMTFPANLSNIRKEKINGWYSISSYYTALSIAEFPFQVIFPIIFCIVAYFMTGQLLELERILYFILIHILMAFVSQSLGLFLGAIFMEDASAAVFLGPITTVPIMLFGGFFVRISTIPWYLRYFTYASFIRYAFEAALINVYGFGRCKVDYEILNRNETTKPEWMGYATMVLGEGGDKFVDNFARSLGGTYDPSSGKPYHSSLLDQYNIDEDYFWFDIAALVIFFFVLRLITYYVLIAKINKRD